MMNCLDVYDAVNRYLSERIDNGFEIEIYDADDISEFMEGFDDWLRESY